MPDMSLLTDESNESISINESIAIPTRSEYASPIKQLDGLKKILPNIPLLRLPASPRDVPFPSTAFSNSENSAYINLQRLNSQFESVVNPTLLAQVQKQE